MVLRIIDSSQFVQLEDRFGRNIRKTLDAVGFANAVQHAIVGADINHRRAAGFAGGKGGVANPVILIADQHRTGIDDIAE